MFEFEVVLCWTINFLNVQQSDNIQKVEAKINK